MKLTTAQQFVLHTLLSLAISVATGVGTVLIQYVSSHPFNLSEIIGFAALAFGGSLSHGLLTLKSGTFELEAVQAARDTVPQVEQLAAHLAPGLAQELQRLGLVATPVVQVQAAQNSASSVPTLTIAPQQQPQPTLSSPTSTASTLLSTPQVSQQFTAPVLPAMPK